MSDADTEQVLREALEELADAGRSLRRRERGNIAEALAEAWLRIADPERALGRAAREREPGLHPGALHEQLGPVRHRGGRMTSHGARMSTRSDEAYG